MFLSFFALNFMPFQSHFSLDLHRQNRCGQIADAHQIVGCAGEGKDPVHLRHSAMAYFAHQRNRLQPAEAFFDPLPFLLTDGIAMMPRRAAIDRAAAWSLLIPGHMRRDVQIPALGDKTQGVKRFVSAHRHPLRSRNLFQHHQRCVSFCPPGGRHRFGLDDQPVAILHQQIPAVTQLRLLTNAFARHQRIRIGLRLVRVIRPSLAAKVHRGIARIIRRSSRLACFRLKALLEVEDRRTGQQ